ncbi:ECF sigma factor [Gemmata obscuriglobus]|uniref:RNA polymerase sigma-70 ECF-like HTH domain-containing protein n=1 Tax=Gemmata obscuriglobus TaxID=114 RepID=A0A2Z3H290_9BACT|nr:ECF-type sigma factor [Gemmata obscuriglobus]AWM40143.1 hypothetical protein C1280_26150 [Gemmata obscuriglobus]QEG26681.1 ECF sigma factor [Gemmata obscuriglobus]VTS02332.1 hypothetical protein : RNA polymerase sigma-70 ECF-like protein OS=Rhodopirellula maiorica SM1 GN=RMSM_04912 PE=4 SV=1: Sigma70_ECF [Gemmata obscuriglobus UQM 2246]
MQNDGSVTDLLLQLRSEAPAVRDRAAGELLQRYTPELLALIAGRTQPRPRQRADTEDVLLSFYNRLRRGTFDLANRDQFLHLVVSVALNTVRAAEGRERQRRDVRRGQPLDAPEEGGRGVDRPAPDVTAEVVTEVAEEIERRLTGLLPECREVLVLRLDGRTTEDIARTIDRTPRTVERRMELVRTLWRDDILEPN